jgi:DNA-binding beta-propeller fold protein YncE
MAVSSDGTRLYIVDSVRGQVSVMDTKMVVMLRSERIDLGGHPVVEGTAAKLSADGGTLFVGTNGGEQSVLYAIDTSTFQVTHRLPVRGELPALGLSGDGLRM